MAPALAIDGDASTRWGGAFSASHWLQIDLGRSSRIGGALIQWDSGFASAYSIQVSVDGHQWQSAFETTDSRGGIDDVFFPVVQARYVRLSSAPRTADWGVSVFEFEPLAERDAPRVSGVVPTPDPAVLWRSTPARTLALAGRKAATQVLDIHLPRALAVAGLEVFWSSAPRNARLEAHETSGRWITLADDPIAPGDSSYLAAAEPHTVDQLRMTVQSADAAVTAIRRLRLLTPSRVMTPMKRYEIAAARAHADLFPASLHAQQVYWTAVGVPGGRQKSVFDEWGDVEAFKGAPLLQPVWRDSSGTTAAAYANTMTHSLRDGWMPMPAVQWSPMPGLQLRSEAFTTTQGGNPVTLVRHRLINTGDRPMEGQLSLLVRPMQMSPPWQNGGLSPIRDVAIERSEGRSAVRVNGRILLEALTLPDAQGASAFGAHGENEITRHAADGTVPESLAAHDADGLAGAVLSYRVTLEAGAHRDIVVAFPLGKERIDATAVKPPDAPAIDRDELMGAKKDAGTAFDAQADRVAREWKSRFGSIGLSLPDRSLVDMLRAQAAYMLINQSGPAIQPGPRNYNRSFIRDGSATAAVLLRMGMAKTSRDYLEWYSGHAVHDNGLVSPILNDDGTVNRGFGSDIEFDSQGEFVWLVAEIARLDGGAASVREYAPKVRLALQFLQQLRERTLAEGYLSDRESPERFRGIIAPSISHEGYSTPTHSYWDDYWALKGWHDGAWLAEQWGDEEMATWARAQYVALRDSVAASIRSTMTWKATDFIPSSADLGDGDPTGVSIGLDPCGQQDLMPADALARTFSRYLDDVRKRDLPDALYAYTPYEMRNVLTYVHLNQPLAAEELLNNLLRHRRPLEWQVLAEVVYSDLRHAIYLGDMPHTWIGSEYARALFGMLMHEGDDRLQLLPGTPPSWIAGEGLKVSDLPTAYGKLSMSARQTGSELRIELGNGLRSGTALEVSWPSRQRPVRVLVDGQIRSDYDAERIHIAHPFRTLIAQWQ